MQKVFVLLFASIIYLYAGSIDKRTLDLDAPGLAKTASFFEYETFANNCLDVTLISGGYFTIGTNSGTVENTLDDRCALLFGHPYAKTSYPVFSVDGQWFKLDEYFPVLSSEMLVKQSDSLIILVEEDQLFQLEFCLSPGVVENKLEISINITNLDSLSHNFGMGLVLDPGIGKWGDGFIYYDDVFISDDVIFTDWPEDLPLNIYEKSVGAKGINFSVDFDSIPPDKIIAANWADLYSSSGPEFTENPLGKIYDLTTKIIWDETEIEPSNSIKKSTTFTLNDPDFTTDTFMRWDLASFLTMENNRLFPRDYETSFEIHNLTDSNLDDIDLKIEIPIGFSLGESESHISIPLGAPAYPQVNLQSNLVYEDYIVGLTARLEEDGVVLDEITRNVYLPATALTDTGLTITDDSLSVVGFPEVNLIFGAEVDQSEQKILNLQKENIFLYENDTRLHDYELDKYAVRGSDLADIVFVLDCSGSMGDNINAVRNNLNEFADSLTAKGYDYQIGVVTFSTTVDDVWDFTNDIDQIKSNLSGISLWGGVENSPAALYKASELSWRPGSKRNIIWITDEPYPEDVYTKEEIVNRMLYMGITVHGVGLNNLQTEWFNPIVMPTGGNFYDIFGNFRDILLDVTDFNSQFLYSIIYDSPNTETGSNTIKLELHYEGLGGNKIFMYEPPAGTPGINSLVCYPNPFNPTITFKFATQNILKGDIIIYNMLGQRIKKIPITKNSPQQITWNASDDHGKSIVSGVYIVRLSFTGIDGKKHDQSARILHLK
ncbi:MAG: VWA domain-containing protein [Calditrichaceae bacterium]